MKFETMLSAIQDELIASPSDRAVAVLGGSIAETSLKQLVVHSAVTNRDFEMLVQRSSANNAQTLAFGMGLIPCDLHAELTLLFRIRNEFAHSVERLEFDHAPVRDMVARFRVVRHPACINGLPVELSDEEGAKMFGGSPQRFRFIGAVGSASRALMTIPYEKPKLQASARLYIDAQGCYSP